MDKLTSQLSNTFSTGGGGFDFERKVQAIFLLGLVINGFSPVLNRQIEKVCFQTKRNGLNTDDLLVVSKNEEARLLCQMKHDLIISEKDKTFQQVITSAWADFKSDNFRIGKDRIALITGIIAKDSIVALRTIYETACTDLSADGFINKINQQNLTNKKTREKLGVIRKCLQKANRNNPVTDDELWQFCKSFVLLVFDVDFIDGVNDCLVKSLINCKSTSKASLVWAKLQEVAGSYNRDGADISLDNLDEEILSCFGLDIPNEQINKQISGFVANDFWGKLAILGSWDENNSYDRNVVQELFGITYDDFEKQIQSYLASGVGFISVTNGIWQVRYRRKLFEICDKYYFDKTLAKAFAITNKILKQRDKRYDNDEEINIFFPQSNNFDNSNNIRRSLVKGLCILSNRCVLQNCSKDKVILEGENFIRSLFKDCDWVKLVSLNELLYLISEISPKTYLKELESYIERDAHGIEKLFPTKQNSWFDNNYICYLLWSIEVLAWHEDYLIDSIRCLGELASLSFEETNHSNTPINSILSILMPWYPQTTASLQKQMNAISSLVKEYPQTGWKVLKGLMPSFRSTTTSGTTKPKYLKIEIPQETSVTIEQTQKIYAHCFSLALEIATNDAQKISELVGYIFHIGGETINGFLAMSREYSNIWDDSQKFNVWLELNEYKYRVIGENEGIEPNSNLFITLNDTITQLTPKDCFYRNKRLFLSDFDEFTANIDDENWWQKKIEGKLEAIKEVHETHGIDGVYNFGIELKKEQEVFSALGKLISVEEINLILIKYINKQYNSEFVHYTIEGFVLKNGVSSLELIGLEKYGSELVVEVLTQMNWFSNSLLNVVHKLLPNNENLFWRKAIMPTCYYSGCDYDFKYVVEKLIENKRFSVIVNMLGKSREIPPINEDIAYEVLEKAATTKQNEVLDPYAVQRLIKRLQDSNTCDIDRLSVIELYYLPWLDKHSRTQPRALKTKIAESPEYFCQIIELAFKKHNSKHDSEKQKPINKIAAQRLYQIIFGFDIVPGTDWNGVFDKEKFKSWVADVIKWSIDNDREAVTKQTVGSGLAYAKPLENGILDEEIIKVLDAKENDEIRKGYHIGTVNKRGVYLVDPEGKPEKALAEKFNAMADSVETLGYSRFSGTLRNIAQHYLNEAERNILSGKRLTESEE